MKRRIVSIALVGCMLVGMIASLTGCGESSSTSAAATEPPFYLSEDELPSDAYYIVRDVTVKETSLTGKESKVKQTRYYPLLQANNTMENIHENKAGYDPSRVTWVNKDLDEATIPTMYATDKMIYKSSNNIPTKYALEKFFDNGYTLGVMGLKQDLSGNYRYSGGDGGGHTMPTSDAVGFDGMEDVESIYLVQVGDERITPLNMSMSGTVTGLEAGKVYSCDVRRGTERVLVDLTANIHYFSSAETYMFGSFTFITPLIAELNIPDYVTTGYYNIGGGGFYRYVADEDITDYTKLAAEDYNKTIYTYNKDGGVDGTSIGMHFDENDFLVEGELLDYDGKVIERDGLTYDEVTNTDPEKMNISITHPTALSPENGGVYTGTYRIDSISAAKIVESRSEYTLQATNVNNNETLDMKYLKSAQKPELVTGETYIITFKEAGNGFDGYKLLTAEPKVPDEVVSPESAETDIEANVESATDETNSTKNAEQSETTKTQKPDAATDSATKEVTDNQGAKSEN